MGYWETLGRSDEWYTPKYLFDALGEMFDLDVAHPNGPSFVPAKRFFHERGLEQEWNGFVWMNPPFGGRNGIAPWLEKFMRHGNGIALVPDRTSAPWFQENVVKAGAVLFVSPKIRFIDRHGNEGKSPSNGTALFAVGARAVSALRRADRLGFVCIPRAALAEDKPFEDRWDNA